MQTRILSFLLSSALCLGAASVAGAQSVSSTTQEPEPTAVGLSLSPSFQRVLFGLDEGVGAYNVLGGTVRVVFDILGTSSPTGHLRLALGLSVRQPLSFAPGDPSRPDLHAFFECGYAFHLGVMDLSPLLDIGFGVTRFSKGTMSALGVELGWRVAREVRVFVTPRCHYDIGLLLGMRNQIAPAVDAGVSFGF